MREMEAFLGRLEGLIQKAKAQDSRITIEEVEAYFSEDALSEEQMDLVFDYLLSRKITVKGYVKMAPFKQEREEDFSEEEKAYLKEYLRDLDAIPPLKEGELEVILKGAILGGKEEKRRLTEISLMKVVEIAKGMHRPEIFLGDLIQEGNLGLILGVEMLFDAKEEPQAFLDRQIRQSIQMLIEEHTDQDSRDKKMVEKVQALDDSIQALSEELGRKVTIDELAIYMGMEIEEIEDILKLSGEDFDDGEEEKEEEECDCGHHHHHEE